MSISHIPPARWLRNRSGLGPNTIRNGSCRLMLLLLLSWGGRPFFLFGVSLVVPFLHEVVNHVVVAKGLGFALRSPILSLACGWDRRLLWWDRTRIHVLQTRWFQRNWLFANCATMALHARWLYALWQMLLNQRGVFWDWLRFGSWASGRSRLFVCLPHLMSNATR